MFPVLSFFPIRRFSRVLDAIPLVVLGMCASLLLVSAFAPLFVPARSLAGLNGGLLCMGGGVMALFVFSGTLQTAESGGVLGRMWSSLWLPLAIFVFAGLMIPVHEGLSVLQRWHLGV